MDVGDAARLFVLIILILLSGFFSSAETAMTVCSRIRIRSMADAGDKRAARLLKVLDNGPKMLSTILIGNNIVNLSASSIATVFATDVFGSQAVGISTGILTFVILIFGEIAPKDAASIHADSMALFNAALDEYAKWYQRTNGAAASVPGAAVQIAANTAARHSHANKRVLDGITAAKTAAWDGKSSFSGRYADLTGKPAALKNPNALTIKIGGTTVTYDGSAAKTVTIADGSEVAY